MDRAQGVALGAGHAASAARKNTVPQYKRVHLATSAPCTPPRRHPAAYEPCTPPRMHPAAYEPCTPRLCAPRLCAPPRVHPARAVRPAAAPPVRMTRNALCPSAWWVECNEVSGFGRVVCKASSAMVWGLHVARWCHVPGGRWPVAGWPVAGWPVGWTCVVGSPLSRVSVFSPPLPSPGGGRCSSSHGESRHGVNGG